MGTMVFIHVIACLFTVSCYIRFIGSKDSFELKKPTEVGPLKSSTRKVCLKAEPGGETELDDDLPLCISRFLRNPLDPSFPVRYCPIPFEQT